MIERKLMNLHPSGKEVADKFATPYLRPRRVLENGGGPTKVERAGYLTTRQIVDMFVRAGKRLTAFRKEQFDGQTPNDAALAEISMRSKSYDLVDASTALRILEERRYRDELLNKSLDERGGVEAGSPPPDKNLVGGVHKEVATDDGKAAAEPPKT